MSEEREVHCVCVHVCVSVPLYVRERCTLYDTI